MSLFLQALICPLMRRRPKTPDRDLAQTPSHPPLPPPLSTTRPMPSGRNVFQISASVSQASQLRHHPNLGRHTRQVLRVAAIAQRRCRLAREKSALLTPIVHVQLAERSSQENGITRNTNVVANVMFPHSSCSVGHASERSRSQKIWHAIKHGLALHLCKGVNNRSISLAYNATGLILGKTHSCAMYASITQMCGPSCLHDLYRHLILRYQQRHNNTPISKEVSQIAFGDQNDLVLLEKSTGPSTNTQDTAAARRIKPC